jgi:integrase
MTNLFDDENSSLADLSERTKHDPTLTPSGRRDRSSAIIRVCDFAGVAPETVPASAPEINRLLERINPVYCGITRRSFQNMVSLVRDALNRNLADQRDDRPAKFVLGPEWAHLVEAAPDKRRLIVLRRFMRFCDLNGWLPQDVDDAVLALFAAMVQEKVILSDKYHVRNVVSAWNRASKTVPGWPAKRLTLAKPGRRFTLDWDLFPKSLRDDLEAYIRFRTKPALTAGHLSRAAVRPIKESSARAFRYQIRALASALVLSGVPMEDLTDLSVIVRRAEVAVGFFVTRHDGTERSVQTHQLASTLLTIGKTWCRLDQAGIEVLQNICSNCCHVQITMTEKNRDKLRVLDDPRIRSLLLALPQTLERLAANTKSARRAAGHMQLAVAIEILINTALRVANLARLDHVRHLRRATANGETHLTIKQQDVKNSVALDKKVPRELVRLIDRFKEKYRPALAGGKPSDFLFPTPSGKHIASNTLSAAISRETKRHLGVQINPHLFRHFAANLHLERYPGDYETVRQMLGHKSIRTTINFYCGKEADAAFERYQQTLIEERKPRPRKGSLR